MDGGSANMARKRTKKDRVRDKMSETELSEPRR